MIHFLRVLFDQHAPPCPQGACTSVDQCLRWSDMCGRASDWYTQKADAYLILAFACIALLIILNVVRLTINRR